MGQNVIFFVVQTYNEIVNRQLLGGMNIEKEMWGMKKMKKGIAAILCVSMLLPIGARPVFADELSSKKTIQCEGTDGDEYTILVESNENMDDFKYRITFTNEDNGTRQIYSYADELFIAKEYTYAGENWFGEEQYSLNETQKTDCSEMINSAEENVYAQGYRTRVTMQIPALNGFQYWYAVGNSGTDVGYTKIGNYNTYKLKNGAKYLEDFKTNVRASNTYVTKAQIAYAVLAGVAVGLVAFGEVVTKAIGITILIAAIGIERERIELLYDGCVAARTAGEYYDMAKGYGTKL